MSLDDRSAYIEFNGMNSITITTFLKQKTFKVPKDSKDPCNGYIDLIDLKLHPTKYSNCKLKFYITFAYIKSNGHPVAEVWAKTAQDDIDKVAEVHVNKPQNVRVRIPNK